MNQLNLSVSYRSILVFLILAIGAFVFSIFLFTLNTQAQEAPPPELCDPGFIWNGEQCVQEGRLSGYKWNDLNGNGVKDDDEPALDGWTITLDNGSSAVTGDGDWPNGYYEFTGLGSSTYYVCEAAQDNWTQTYPNDNIEDLNDASIYNGCEDDDDTWSQYGYRVEIDENSAENLNFGNFKYGHIFGHKYSDETDEPIEDWKIYAIYPDGEVRYRTTDDDGYYYFSDLGPGEYQVCEEVSDGGCITYLTQVYPEEFYIIAMRSDANGLDNPYNFRNRTEKADFIVYNMTMTQEN